MALTKKDAFSWTLEATKDFEQLKEVMCEAPILTTPDFTKTFIVECDLGKWNWCYPNARRKAPGF